MRHLIILTVLVVFSCGPENSKSKKYIGRQDSILVSLIVDFGEFAERVELKELQISEGLSVYSGLKAIEDLHPEVSFGDTLFGHTGHFLQTINTVKSQEGKYWIYCLNNRLGSKGIDQQILKDGDQIKWVLTSKRDPCK